MKNRVKTPGIIALATGFLVALLPPSLPNATPRRVDSLLARHAAALGGLERLLAARTRYTESSLRMESTGLEGRVRTWSALPCFSRTEIDLGLFSVRQGFDGERAWIVDQNGKVSFREDPASVSDRETTCMLESWAYLLGDDAIEAEAAGPDTVGGVPCETVVLRPADGSPCRLLLSRETFLPAATVISSPAGEIRQLFGDWRPVEGIMVPFETVTEHTAIGQRLATRIDSIELDPPIDPALFRPPPEDARDYRFAEGAGASIHFSYHLRHLYVPVQLPGVEGTRLFLLDSGAGMTVIDSVLAAEMALPAGGRISGIGAGGATDFRMTRLPGLEVPGIDFDEQTVVVYPIDRVVGRLTGRTIGGILGYDFLSRFAAVIDYGERFIALSDPDSFAVPAGEATVEAPLVNNIFSLPAVVDGEAAGRFLLDTGANTSALRPGFLEEHGLLAGRRRARISITGAGGASDAFLVRLRSIEIGGHTLSGPVTAVGGGMEGVWSFGGIDGIVGNDLLERFTVILDYRGQRVALIPNERFGEPFHRDKSGIHASFDEHGRPVIRWIVPGSPAAAAGLRPGDVIRHIDGAPVNEGWRNGRFGDAFSRDEGTRVRIRYERGGRKMRANLLLDSYI